MQSSDIYNTGINLYTKF